MTDTPLVLGPMLRYVDETSACVWVETGAAATVAVRADGRVWRARTFRVHGHHYALVEVDGLASGREYPYEVEIDGSVVWPEPDSEFPPSVIPTLDLSRRLRMAFGSCRTSVSHDRDGNRTHGVDALRALALSLAGKGVHPAVRRPDFVLFLGDQVYADETTEPMTAFIESRRSLEEPPWDELKDWEEYAHLYWLAWTDPANRWFLSTVPTAMIFDDHDIRDDWNTSRSWKEEMDQHPWWHERIVAGLGSYWVYQHLGNLTPDERRADELWRRVQEGHGEEEVDLTEAVDAFAERVDEKPETYRWSYARDLGERVRLVVVDSRAARVLTPGDRSILDDEEMAWLDDHMKGDVAHLLVGSSLPFLLAPGLHHLEAWNEAMCNGAWGRPMARFGEWMRQTVDLEHWAAFQHGFAEVAEMALSVAYGERGEAPDTVTFLGGDVHHSYVSEVKRVKLEQAATPNLERLGRDPHVGATSRRAPRSRIVQAVCSPIRNPLPRVMRFGTAFLSYGLAGPMGAVAAKSAHVPDPPFRWRNIAGPWFDNNVAVLEDTPRGLRMRWFTGVVVDGDHDQPHLHEVTDVLVQPGRPRGVSRVSRLKARLRRYRAGRSRRPR